MAKILILMVSVLSVRAALGQSFTLPSLFRSGVRLNSAVVATGQDSVNLGFGTIQASGVIPIYGKIKLEWEDFNIKGHQTFATLNLGHRAIWSKLTATSSVAHLVAGATHLRVGLRNGLWLYILNLGTFSSGYQTIPLGVVSAVRVQIRGLRKQNFFGVAAVGTAGLILPLPVLGLNRRISEKWDLKLLFPSALDIVRSFNSRHSLNFKLNGQFFQIPTADSYWQYRQLQVSAAWQKKSRNWQFRIESGLALARSLRVGSRETSLTPAPYAALSLNYNFGGQKIGSQSFINQ